MSANETEVKTPGEDIPLLPKNNSESKPSGSGQEDTEIRAASQSPNQTRVMDTGPDFPSSEYARQRESPSPVAVTSNTDDRPTLLAFMCIRFREKRHSYSYSATFYRRLDTFLFFLPLMILQCAVGIVYVAANGNEEFQRIFSGCAAAVSSVLIAIQMKMKWGETSERFNSAARQYALLASETFFKWLTAQAMSDEEFRDFVKDTGNLEKEIQDTTPIPPSWIISKFELHRLQLTVSDSSGAQIIPTFIDPNTHKTKKVDRNQPRQTPTAQVKPRSGKAESSAEQFDSASKAEAGLIDTTNVPSTLLNLQPTRFDMGSNPSGLFEARSRLRLSRPGGPVVELRQTEPRVSQSVINNNNRQIAARLAQLDSPQHENIDNTNNRPDLRLQRFSMLNK